MPNATGAAIAPNQGKTVVKPYPFTAQELETAARLLEGWVAAPGW